MSLKDAILGIKKIRKNFKSIISNLPADNVDCLNNIDGDKLPNYIENEQAVIVDDDSNLQEIKSLNPSLYQSFIKLNSFQQSAIFSRHKKNLVCAMVGSGKTTVLVHKVLYLHFIKKIPLNKIAILTFTNKAANEIIERINTFYIGDKKQVPDLSFFGTFHSVAKNILQKNKNIQDIGYKDDFTIMDENERLTFYQRIATEYNLNIKYFNKIDKRLERYLDKKSTTTEKKILYGNMKHPDDIERLVSLGEERKKLYNVMGFDDLISNVNFILPKNIDSFTFDWIVIDEFQDCNTEQIDMIANMSNLHTSIFAVGDPNQLIYEWRGSDIKVFTEFKKFDCEEYSLPINYRSTSNILDLATYLKTYGQDNLLGSRSEGLPVTIVNHYDSNQEAIYLAKKIKDLTINGTPHREIAILFRTKNQTKIFETVFQHENIPFEIANRKSIKEFPSLNWLNLLFKACLNIHDINSAYDVIFNNDFGFFEPSPILLNKYLTENKKNGNRPNLDSFLKYIEDYAKDDKYFWVFSKKMSGFQLWLNSIEAERISEIFDYFDLSIILKPTSVNYENDVNLIKNFLIDLSNYIKFDYNANVKQSLLSIVSKIGLGGINLLGETIDPNSEKVKLLTIHTSKGLEFSYVFISGANNGLIPLGSNMYGNGLEEEKRLFFVAVTRAKDFLEISYHTNPEGWSSTPELSLFLNRLPKNVIKLSKKKSNNLISSSVVDPAITKLDQWYLGQTIGHHKYGNGTISKITQSNITCNFEGFGEKSFSPNFLSIFELN